MSEAQFSLRRERPEDDAFLLELFDSSAGAMLRRGGVPEPMVQQLVQMQHRARSAAYRDACPGADFWIVEQDDRPVGRLVEHDRGDEVHVVDIALVPERRGQGLGRALLRSRQALWAEQGRRASATVAPDNTPSRRLFTGLGFVESDASTPVNLDFVWTPLKSDGRPG